MTVEYAFARDFNDHTDEFCKDDFFGFEVMGMCTLDLPWPFYDSWTA